MYSFSEEFYTVPSFDIVRIFLSGLFIGAGIIMVPAVQNYLNKKN